MKNSKLLSNQVIDKINQASEENLELTLTAQEVKELSEVIGDTIFFPIYTMEELGEEFKRRKLEEKQKEIEEIK